MYAALFILLLLALLSMLFCHFRRRKIICRIRDMEKCEKCSLLEELAQPFGYAYHCCCGFFSSTLDAWQKSAGYAWVYDYMAPRLLSTVGGASTASMPAPKSASTTQTGCCPRRNTGQRISRRPARPKC